MLLTWPMHCLSCYGLVVCDSYLSSVWLSPCVNEIWFCSTCQDYCDCYHIWLNCSQQHIQHPYHIWCCCYNLVELFLYQYCTCVHFYYTVNILLVSFKMSMSTTRQRVTRGRQRIKIHKELALRPIVDRKKYFRNSIYSVCGNKMRFFGKRPCTGISALVQGWVFRRG